MADTTPDRDQLVPRTGNSPRLVYQGMTDTTWYFQAPLPQINPLMDMDPLEAAVLRAFLLQTLSELDGA